MTPLPPTHPPCRYERGGVTWVTLLLVALVLGAGYLAVVWVPVYVLDYEVKQVVRDYMNQAVKNPDDAQLLNNMCAKLRVLEKVRVVREDGSFETVPLVNVRPEDVTWTREASAVPPMVRVSFEYKRDVHFPFLDRVQEWTSSIALENDLTRPDWGPAR